MRPPISQLLPLLAVATLGCIRRVDRPAAATVVRDGRRVNTPVVPQPADAEKESSPEQILRTFLVAMVEADEAGIRSVALPRPNMEVLWRETVKVEPEVREQMLRDVRQARLRRLQVGEVIMLPSRNGARRMEVTENDVNDGHLLIQMYDDPLPYILVKVEQHWRVDPGTIIAGRLAAEESRRRRQAGGSDV